MPDITMCQSKACPRSKTCRRHCDSGTEPDPLRQSWFSPDPEPEDCKMYWPTLHRFTQPAKEV